MRAHNLFLLVVALSAVVACGGQALPEDGAPGGVSSAAGHAGTGDAGAAGSGGAAVAQPGAGGATAAAAGSGGGVDASAGAPASPRSFHADVRPIFDKSCALAGCHGPDSYISLRLGPVAAYSSSQVLDELQMPAPYLDPKLRFVSPGDPDGSLLVRKIEGDFASLACAKSEGCGSQMPPKNQPPLSAADIDTIRTWIAEGALDN